MKVKNYHPFQKYRYVERFELDFAKKFEKVCRVSFNDNSDDLEDHLGIVQQ